MLSSNSLQAFSSASTTAPISRPDSANPVRLARTQVDAPGRQASPQVQAIPSTPPSVPPPRGSLLNLSV